MNNSMLWLIVGIGALLFLGRNGGAIPPTVPIGEVPGYGLIYAGAEDE